MSADNCSVKPSSILSLNALCSKHACSAPHYEIEKGWIVGHRGNFYFARISAAGSGIRSVIGRGRTQDEAKERAAALYLKSLKKQFLRVNFTCEASAAIPSNELLANTELIMSPNRGDNKREHEDTIGATRPSKRRKLYKPHQPRQSFCTKLSCTHEYAEKAENARIRFTELLHRQESDDEGLATQRSRNVGLEKASADEAFYAHRAAKGFCIAYGLSGDPQWKQLQLHYVERAADSFFRACQYAWDRKTKKKNVEQCMRMMAILAVEGRRSHNAVKMTECSLRNELALTKPGLNHTAIPCK